ncbi:MAG: class II fructose-bisphosphate aldolase [Candidatus Wildermuthbacteria bacterium]|nr:class II fructose-bisphosphate aldolase [Candidatus Wildermuthbacteria bacterium]
MKKIRNVGYYLQKAREEQWAVPHFNFSSLAQLNGIVDVIRELRIPALLGTSEGERAFVGMNQALALIKSFQNEGLPVFLNADHCHSAESAIEAFEAGYDSIHIDLSKKPWEENLEETKRVVKYVKRKRSGASVEGELGYLATDSSKIYKEEIHIPEKSYTNADQAVEFVKKTGIDRLAPAIGTIHGIAANTPHLRMELAKELRTRLPDVDLVLHGGSGVGSGEIEEVVKIGFNNVHISTEVRVAFTNGVRRALAENKDETAPHAYLGAGRKAVSALVREKIRLLGAINAWSDKP